MIFLGIWALCFFLCGFVYYKAKPKAEGIEHFIGIVIISGALALVINLVKEILF